MTSLTQRVLPLPGLHTEVITSGMKPPGGFHRTNAVLPPTVQNLPRIYAMWFAIIKSYPKSRKMYQINFKVTKNSFIILKWHKWVFKGSPKFLQSRGRVQRRKVKLGDITRGCHTFFNRGFPPPQKKIIGSKSALYCMSKQYCPFLYGDYLYINGQDFSTVVIVTLSR